MKKKILAMLLAVALTVALAAPAISTNANAAEEYNPYHCECGAQQFESAEATEPKDPTAVCADGCGEEKNLTWKPYSDFVAAWEADGRKTTFAPTESGNYYLPAETETEIEFTTKINVSTTIRIDLNGSTLARKTNRVSQVDGGILVLTDTSDEKDGVLASKKYVAGGTGAVILVTGGRVKQLAGKIDGAQAVNDAAHPTDGGSVYVYSSSAAGNPTFNMYGGTITGGYATNHGGNVAVGAMNADCGKATFNMYGGTIQNGTATSGGNVSVKINATFRMDGGTIKDGSTEAGDTKHGGNMRVSDGGVLNMYGGIIKDGIANGTNDAKASNGGNIALIGVTSKLNFYGGVVSGGTVNTEKKAVGNSVWAHTGTTAGNITVSGDPVINNIYLHTGKTVTIGEDGLTTGAEIGIQMEVTGAFVSSGATEADAEYFFDGKDGKRSVRFANGALSLLVTPYVVNGVAMSKAEAEEAMATAIGPVNIKVSYDRTSEGISVPENASVIIDLNGHKLGNGVELAEGATMTLIDSASDDYETAGVMVKVTGEGTVKPDAVVNSKRYVAIKETVNEDTYYSAHRIYLAVTSSVLSNGCSAMNFKTVLKCNSYVAMRVEEYGVTVGGETRYYPDANVAAGNNEKTTTLTGFLKGDADDATWAATDVQVGATFKLDDGTVVNSAVKARSLQAMVETVVEGEGWNGLDADKKTTLKTLYATYGQSAGMDSWAIPAEMKAN